MKPYILEGLKIIRVFNHGLGMSGLYLRVSPIGGSLGQGAEIMEKKEGLGK